MREIHIGSMSRRHRKSTLVDVGEVFLRSVCVVLGLDKVPSMLILAIGNCRPLLFQVYRTGMVHSRVHIAFLVILHKAHSHIRMPGIESKVLFLLITPHRCIFKSESSGSDAYIQSDLIEDFCTLRGVPSKARWKFSYQIFGLKQPTELALPLLGSVQKAH